MAARSGEGLPGLRQRPGHPNRHASARVREHQIEDRTSRAGLLTSGGNGAVGCPEPRFGHKTFTFGTHAGNKDGRGPDLGSAG